MDITLAVIYTILLLFLIAILLQNALPPIVKEAMIAVIIKPTQKICKLYIFDIVAVIVTPAEPDIIPHISPITSLQNDDTLSAFFLNDTAFFAPFIFLALIAFNGLSVVEVTATPIISNIIPIAINIINIIIPIINPTLDSVISDINEKINDIINASSVMVIIHFTLLFFFFFDILFPFI